MLLRIIIDDHYHAEGIENVWARHRTLSAAVHAAVDAWASGDGVLKANMDEPSERSVRTLSPPSPHIHI